MNELTEGQRALQMATDFKCPVCYDTHLARLTKTPGLFRVLACNDCPGRIPQRGLAINEAIDRLIDQPIEQRLFDCARALACATAQRPVRGFTLGLFLRVGEREVKALIQTLRDEWHLPIGSLRVPPYGYYWISSPEEFLAWFNPMKAQALSEMRTAHRLMRRHYPELAGQFTFDFENEEVSPDGITNGLSQQ